MIIDVNMADKDSLEKLLVYQQELQAEEKCLRRIISKLNVQAHALQVEQLHILSAIKSSKANSSPNESNESSEINMKKEAEFNPESIKLDLEVPTYQSCEEDEDEMDD